MARFVMILDGPSADRAKPILALNDPRAVQAVLRAVGELIAEPPETGAHDGRLLRLHQTRQAVAETTAQPDPREEICHVEDGTSSTR
jgi:hypothetical protein